MPPLLLLLPPPVPPLPSSSVQSTNLPRMKPKMASAIAAATYMIGICCCWASAGGLYTFAYSPDDAPPGDDADLDSAANSFRMFSFSSCKRRSDSCAAKKKTKLNSTPHRNRSIRGSTHLQDQILVAQVGGGLLEHLPRIRRSSFHDAAGAASTGWFVLFPARLQQLVGCVGTAAAAGDVFLWCVVGDGWVWKRRLKEGWC